MRTQLWHPTSQVGCTSGHAWSPARHKPPLQHSGLRPTLACPTLALPPLTGTWARCSLYSLPSHMLPLSVRNLRVTLQTYWGGLPRAWNCGKTQICVSDSFWGCSLAHDTRVTQEASLLTEIAQMGTLHNPLGTAPQTKSPRFLRRESFSKLSAWNSSSGQGTNFLKFPQMWPLIVRHTHAFSLIDYTNNYSSNNSNKSGSRRTVCQALG